MADYSPPETSDDLTYDDYTAAGYSGIVEDSWSNYAARAWDIVRDVTQYACDEVTDADTLARVHGVVLRTAEALYSSDTGVVSEKLGSYNVTYRHGVTTNDVYRIARLALSGTGLNYVGLL